MRDESLLLGIPKILTASRLVRAIVLPLTVATLAAATAAAAIISEHRGVAVTALAWSAGALLLMRPDEARLNGALARATSGLRSFLARREDVRHSPLSARFLTLVNPLTDEHGWPTLVLLGGLPRGGWSLFAVPPLLASFALFTAGAFLVVGLPAPIAVLLLLAFATAALLLGLDAYAAMLRGTLIPLAPTAGQSLHNLLVVLATLDRLHPDLDRGGDKLTRTTQTPDLQR